MIILRCLSSPAQALKVFTFTGGTGKSASDKDLWIRKSFCDLYRFAG